MRCDVLDVMSSCDVVFIISYHVISCRVVSCHVISYRMIISFIPYLSVSDPFAPVVSSTLRFPRAGHWLIIIQFAHNITHDATSQQHMIAAMYDIHIEDDVMLRFSAAATHGIGMIVAFVILTPASLLCTTYARHPLWHIASRLSTACAIILVSLSYASAHWGFSTHTHAGHAVLGALVMLLVCVLMPYMVCHKTMHDVRRESVVKQEMGQSYW